MEVNSPIAHHPSPITKVLDHTYCVIMAGGRGERFWPLSADNMPKPFLKILGDKTLIQLTVERIGRILPREKIFIVLGKPHVSVARDQLPELPSKNFLVEPEGRDTAACIGFAAISIQEIDSKALMIVLPADHFIPDEERFTKTVVFGMDIANKESCLVTIGIHPSRPETGYGYINARKKILSSDRGDCFRVERFIEKPDAQRARQYVSEGTYFWNAGMFIWKVEAVLAGIARHMPDLFTGLLNIQKALAERNEERFAEIYTSLVRKSIDYGLMEKADNVLMVPGEFAWDDVGTWSSLLRVKDLGEGGNYCSGDIYSIDTKDSVMYSDGATVGAIGLSNVIIIASKDGILVCNADRAQDVREIARLVEKKREKK
jgi:mannose-1-phosphate guanylyltransferase